MGAFLRFYFELARINTNPQLLFFSSWFVTSLVSEHEVDFCRIAEPIFRTVCVIVYGLKYGFLKATRCFVLMCAFSVVVLPAFTPEVCGYFFYYLTRG